jgi:hypothetical protein
MMGYVAIKAFSYYNTACNNYSKPLFGIQTPILVGIGGLIVGVILMLVSWPFFTGYFSRRGGEAADPAALEADAAHDAAVPTPGEPPELTRRQPPAPGARRDA